MAASAFELEPHGNRRRRQLLRVAAHIIESEGVDALRMPRIAELAGCARSLVYRYFPRREDVFCAVIAEFYEQLEERITPTAQVAGMQAVTDLKTVRQLLDAIWDVVEEIGTAGLILHASPRLGAQLSDRLFPEMERFEERWVAPIRAAGLGEIETALVMRFAIVQLTELVDRTQRGEVDREQAILLGQRALASLISGLATPEASASDNRGTEEESV